MEVQSDTEGLHFVHSSWSTCIRAHLAPPTNPQRIGRNLTLDPSHVHLISQLVLRTIADWRSMSPSSQQDALLRVWMPKFQIPVADEDECMLRSLHPTELLTMSILQVAQIVLVPGTTSKARHLPASHSRSDAIGAVMQPRSDLPARLRWPRSVSNISGSSARATTTLGMILDSEVFSDLIKSQEEISDCQDWLVAFVERMVQLQLIPLSSLETVRGLIATRVALMPDPDGRRSEANTDQSYSGPQNGSLIFGSSIQAIRSLMQQIHQHQESDQQYQAVQHSNPQIGQSQQGPQASRPQQSAPARIGQSDWIPDRSRYER